MTHARRLVVSVTGALVLVLAFAGPAFAHATLQSSTPSNGSRVDTSPPQIVLQFDEHVEVSLGGIRVFDSALKRVDQGKISHPNGIGSEVALALPHLKDGGYIVTWRVISADSHPVQGAFTFTVGNAAPAKATDVSGLLSHSGGSRLVGVTYGVGRFIAFASLLVLLGTLSFVALIWPAGGAHRRVRTMALVALGVLAAATVVNLVLQGGYAAGLTLSGSLSGTVIADVLKTRLGHVYELRLALLVIAVGVVAFLGRRPALPSWWRGAALIVGVGIAATPGLAGHASTGTNQPYALVADVAHVCAASAWIGGLVVLLAVVLPKIDFDESTAVVQGFSRNAMYAVTIIIATGVFQAWRQIGTYDALKSTSYGKLVVVKTLLVAAVLCIAVASRNLVHKRWTPDSTRKLRLTVSAEALVAVGVLAVTSMLVNAVPAKTLAAKPQSGELTGQSILIDYTATPGRTGPNQIHLYALTKAGQPKDVVEMQMTLSLPAKNIAPITVPLENAGPGHFQSLNFVVPFSGQWTMKVTARTSDIDEEVLSGSVTFR